MAIQLPNGRNYFATATGAPGVGYKLYTYVPGTSTPKATYTTSAASVSNTNPVVADARGEMVIYWEGSYDVVLRDSNDSLIWGPERLEETGSADDLEDRLSDASDVAEGDAMVGAYDTYAPAYLKNLSQIRNGERYNMLNAVPTAQRAGIQAFTSTYDAYSDMADVLSDMGTAKRGDLYLSDGLYNTSAALAPPRWIKISGPGRRGFGLSGSTGRGAMIKATGNTGVFAFGSGSLLTSDILLEGFQVYGTGGGTPDGISINGCCGATLRNMVVYNFGGNNIATATAGVYGLICERVYSAFAGNADFYLTAEKSRLIGCESDGGAYSVLTTSTADELELIGGYFEGATTQIMQLAGRYNNIIGPWLISTSGTVSPLKLKSTMLKTHVSKVQGRGNAGASLIGLELEAGCADYSIDSCSFAGCVTAAKISEGSGEIKGGRYQGGTTGVEFIGGTYPMTIGGGALIMGASHSLLHTSGNGLLHLGDVLLRNEDNTAFKRMTVTAGYPHVSTKFLGSTPTVASGSTIALPYDTDTVFISGTTAITSITATGHDNRTVKLIFQGILTFTDGSNLKLNGNFTTSADDTITLFCDGTNFYELARSAN